MLPESPTSLAELTAHLAVGTITEVIRQSLAGLSAADEWMRTKSGAFDPLGIATRRYMARFEGRHDRMRIFGMEEPRFLREIFVRVNVLEEITALQRQDIAELQSGVDLADWGFGVARETREALEAVNKHPRIMLLGRPGAGKTTFLKHVGLRALDGALTDPKIPVFVSLREWDLSNRGLLDFIVGEFKVCGFPNAQPFVERLLTRGGCVVLLDGLDEMSDDTTHAVRAIRDFVDKFSDCRFVITCRIAGYNYVFEGFTDIELADFDSTQVRQFADQWFGKQSVKANQFWEEVNTEGHRRIRELASTPLLLTMVCIAFDESVGFPSNRAELFKEALDALLKKWDATREIVRGDRYRTIPLRQKEAMLATIAARMFEAGEYFVPQRVIERYIGDYVQHLSGVEMRSVPKGSEAILKAIEAQHGLLVERAKRVYSFSHLTFQEFFTARYAVEHEARQATEVIVRDHLFEDRWQEVTLLTAGMLARADDFMGLIRSVIDDELRRPGADTLLRSMFEVVAPKNPFPTSIAKGMAIFRCLELDIARGDSRQRHETRLSEIRGLALGLVRLLCRHYEDQPRVGLLHLNLSLDRGRHLASDMSQMLDLSHDIVRDRGADLVVDSDALDAVKKALAGTTLLLGALTSDCYIDRELRARMIEELVRLPAEIA